jgi:cell division protein FtsB
MPRPTSAPGDPQQPVMMPPVALPGSPQLPAKIDPHVRNTPTAAGGRLGLAPYEVPTDRVVELTLHLERLLAENRTLVARIKELETAGLSREQALAEAAREVESVTADAARTRAALQAQIVGLQGRVRQLEEEDIIFLRAVIDALSRLLPPEKKP